MPEKDHCLIHDLHERGYAFTRRDLINTSFYLAKMNANELST